MTPTEITARLRNIVNDAESAITLLEPAPRYGPEATPPPDVIRARPYIARIWTAAETILNQVEENA